MQRIHQQKCFLFFFLTNGAKYCLAWIVQLFQCVEKAFKACLNGFDESPVKELSCGFITVHKCTEVLSSNVAPCLVPRMLFSQRVYVKKTRRLRQLVDRSTENVCSNTWRRKPWSIRTETIQCLSLERKKVGCFFFLLFSRQRDQLITSNTGNKVLLHVSAVLLRGWSFRVHLQTQQ